MIGRCCPDNSLLPCSLFNQASKYMVPFVPTYPGEPPSPSYTSYPGNPATGETEFYLLPAVEELRDAILDTYDDGLGGQEFTSFQGPCHYGITGYENKVDEIGPSIDSLDLHTEKDLGTLGPDDFFIVYGVNHRQTGKAMYMNVTLYGKTKQCAADQVPDPNLRLGERHEPLGPRSGRL